MITDLRWIKREGELVLQMYCPIVKGIDDDGVAHISLQPVEWVDVPHFNPAEESVKPVEVPGREAKGGEDAEARFKLALSLLRRGRRAIDILVRVFASPTTTPAEMRLRAAMQYLKSIHDLIDEEGPDVDWLKDYFTLTGEHMILGEEGWEPGSQLAAYRETEPEWMPLDEVNAPSPVEQTPKGDGV